MAEDNQNETEATSNEEAKPNKPADKKAMTAGQRLAAAKAAKAARKAAAKAADDEVIEDEAIQRAEEVTSWVQKHQKEILIGVGVAAAAAALLLGVQHLSGSSARAASAALNEAMETAEAPVGEAPPDAPSGVERYEDAAGRDAVFLQEAEAMLAEHGDSEAAAFARLAVARLKLQAGESDEAQALYEAALAAAGDNTVVRASAIEGLAFVNEAAEEWAEADARYESLADIGGGYEHLATYHRARMQLMQGDEDGAKERLQGLLEALRAEDAPQLPYVQDQAELTLMGIDASLVERSAGGGGLDQLTPEQIQQLLRMQQQQGGAR